MQLLTQCYSTQKDVEFTQSQSVKRFSPREQTHSCQVLQATGVKESQLSESSARNRREQEEIWLCRSPTHCICPSEHEWTLADGWPVTSLSLPAWRQEAEWNDLFDSADLLLTRACWRHHWDFVSYSCVVYLITVNSELWLIIILWLKSVQS